MKYQKLINERGLLSLELALVLPLIVLFVMFFIGMGHTIITRQHAVVAARYAATFEAIHHHKPKESQVSAAAGGDVWHLSSTVRNSGGATLGGLGRIPDIIAGPLGLLAGAGGNRGEIDYSAKTAPDKGLLPRMYRMRDAESQYQIANGTWTCESRGGVFSLITSQVELPGMSFLQTLSCCRTYHEGQKGKGE